MHSMSTLSKSPELSPEPKLLSLMLSYLSLEGGGSELLLKSLDRVSSMELKVCTVEMRDEDARILDICGHTAVGGFKPQKPSV